MKNNVKMIALALAAIIMCGTLAGLMGVMARAAAADYSDFFVTYYSNINSNQKEVSKISSTIAAMSIEFWYVDEIANVSKDTELKVTNFDLKDPWSTNSGAKLTLIIGDNLSGDKWNIGVKLENVRYTRSTTLTTLGIDIEEVAGNSYTANISTFIPDDYFSSTGTNSGDDENPYSSDIIIENVYINDADGQRIDKVDEDSPPFTIVVTYLDRGLREVDSDDFHDRNLEAYLTSAGGFVPTRGNSGTLKYIADSSNGLPRFRATFNNMTFKSGSNSIEFRANYDIYGYEVEGKATAVVHAAGEDDKDKLAPLTPHIIVNQYAYGDGQIVAGDGFTLSLSIKNTSADLPLENIIMTVTPQTIDTTATTSATGGLTITSASNTIYIENLGAGESLSHSIDLRAEPNAAVGSHKVQIRLKFQYVDEINKERKDGEDEENIAIPVTQIDRFSVDPLTDFPEILTSGETGYVSLSFINRGKSTTYNISGFIQGELPVAGQSQHFGNLNAGESGYLDFEVYSYDPGEMTGEIVLQYEDENANQNEVVVPFTITVEEPYMSPMGDIGSEETVEENTGPSTATTVMCILGGLMMAAPITLYLHKRVKAKGIEEIDEDF